MTQHAKPATSEVVLNIGLLFNSYMSNFIWKLLKKSLRTVTFFLV